MRDRYRRRAGGGGLPGAHTSRRAARLGQWDWHQDAALLVGVLLVNLGTPDTADARGVRVYLKEFLSDPRVIEDQGLRWKLILNGIILRVRPGRKARDYRKIWNTERDESPLKTITRAQAEK